MSQFKPRSKAAAASLWKPPISSGPLYLHPQERMTQAPPLTTLEMAPKLLLAPVLLSH